MPSDTDRIVENLTSTLGVFDRELFLETAQTLRLLSPRELSFYLKDPSSRPELATGQDHIDKRLLVLARGVALELTTEAAIKPENDPDGRAGKKASITAEEKLATENVNLALNSVEGTYGEEYRAANNALRAAEKALSVAMAEAEHASQSPQIGHQAQLAAKNNAIKMKAAVATAANEDRRLHQVYTNACRSLLPGKSGSNDPLGIIPQDPEAAAKPPPING